MSGRAIFIVCSLLLGGFAPLPGPPVSAGDHQVALRETLDWEHPGLQLLLWDVAADGDLVQLRFALQLKHDDERARTWIGFPRYRTRFSGSWQDTVFQGPHGRSRVLEVAGHQDGRAFFVVMVPHDAELLSLPLGEDELRLDLERWIKLAPAHRGGHHAGHERRGSSIDDTAGDRRAVPSDDLEPSAPLYEAVETFPSEAPPGRPVRLETELRWMGEKPFGDGALDAGESGELLLDVINDGGRAARGLVVRISPASIPHLIFSAETALPTIDAPGVETVSLPFIAEPGVADGTIPMTIQVIEPFGHDGAPIEFELTVRGTNPQLVLIDDFAVEGSSLPVPRDTIVTVRLRVRNVGQGSARDVTARVGAGEGVFRAHDSEEQFGLGDLEPGQIGEIAYRCYANRRADQMLLEVDLWDAASGPEPIRSQVILPLEDSSATARIVRVTPDPRQTKSLPPPPAPLVSDVDRFVPSTSDSRPEALAVVLGVSAYTAAPQATFAANDARTAARYFQHALGIPTSRVQLLLDDEVTLGQLQRIFGRDGWLARRIHDDTEVFVYFAGHGMAQLGSFEPYLIPADGDLNYIQQTGFPLDRLIESLVALDARRVTVFIDACFSGLTREGGALLADARPLALVPSQKEVTGLSLFTAARGSQLASALLDQGHGLFSYFLFKGLGGSADLDQDGSITAGELGAYLEEAVPRAAAELDREQTPSIFIEKREQVLLRF